MNPKYSNLRNQIMDAGYTLREVADAIGMTKSNVENYFYDSKRTFPPEKLKAIKSLIELHPKERDPDFTTRIAACRRGGNNYTPTKSKEEKKLNTDINIDVNYNKLFVEIKRSTSCKNIEDFTYNYFKSNRYKLYVYRKESRPLSINIIEDFYKYYQIDYRNYIDDAASIKKVDEYLQRDMLQDKTFQLTEIDKDNKDIFDIFSIINKNVINSSKNIENILSERSKTENTILNMNNRINELTEEVILLKECIVKLVDAKVAPKDKAVAKISFPDYSKSKSYSLKDILVPYGDTKESFEDYNNKIRCIVANIRKNTDKITNQIYCDLYRNLETVYGANIDKMKYEFIKEFGRKPESSIETIYNNPIFRSIFYNTVVNMYSDVIEK